MTNIFDVVKKGFMCFILTILLFLTFGCNSDNQTKIEKLYEQNYDVIDLIAQTYGVELVFTKYGEVETTLSVFSTPYKYAYYTKIRGENKVVVAEYEDDISAASLNKNTKIEGYYSRIGNILFSTDFLGYVFVYGDEKLHIDWENDCWIELPSEEKVLLSYGISHKPINDALIIDGYEIVAGNSMVVWYVYNKDEKNFEVSEIIIGDYVKKIKFNSLVIPNYTGALVLGKNLEYISQPDLYAKYNYIIVPKGIDFVEYKGLVAKIIYCEEKVKPREWDPRAMKGTDKIYWAGQWEYDEVTGEPKPIETE